MKNLVTNKILWYISTAIAVFVALAGIVDSSIYNQVMPVSFVPASFAQDLLTIVVGVVLAILIATTRQSDTKKQTVIIGIIGSINYLYAIFAIERVYNYLYLCYLAIYAVTFYSTVLSVKSIDLSSKWKLPFWVRLLTTVFSIFVAVLFTFLWTSALLPLMQTRNRIDSLYSIYFLDLVFVMPMFVITAISNWHQKTFGLLLTPAMYILGIFVIFPLGLGELAKPFYGVAVDTKSMTMSFILSASFFSFAILQLRTIRPLSVSKSKPIPQ